MLENLYLKYKNNDIEEVVYKLTYADKFIIVKGRSLAGSLLIINNTYNQYSKDNERFTGHLYKHLYDHYKSNSGGSFKIKILAKKGHNTDQYALLKKEQMELDKNRYNPACLNNELEAYIPNYNELTDSFGWLNKTAVMNFKRYLNSKMRKAYIKRYSKKPDPEPARNGL